MKQFRTAIVGTGAIANAHVTALRQAGDRVFLCAAVGIDESRLKTFCAEHHIHKSYIDTNAMLADQQPDLVIICTPPDVHKTLAIDCLEAGAWVNCEKPLCASLAELDEIEAAEKRSGRYVNTVLQWRSGSAARHLRQLIHSGALGPLLLGTCQTLWYRDAGYYQVPWRGKWKTETGGTITGHGTHLIDLFLWLINDQWQEVQAYTATLGRAIEVENLAVALAAFESGALANITSSAVSPRQETHLRLDFQKASVEVRALYSYTNQDWCVTLPEGIIHGAELSHWQNPPDDKPGDHTTQLLALLDSMEYGERPPINIHETRRVMEFIASLYKAAITHQPVKRGSITTSDPFYHAMNGKP